MSADTSIEIRILETTDEDVLTRVAPDVFDDPLDPQLVQEFLNDPRHHLSVAIDDGQVVGMVSGVHYVHPDKPAELWINEVGVASSHRGRGLGKRMLQVLFGHAVTLGCSTAWVVTDSGNRAAGTLYRSVGGVKEPPGTELYEFQLGDDS